MIEELRLKLSLKNKNKRFLAIKKNAKHMKKTQQSKQSEIR